MKGAWVIAAAMAVTGLTASAAGRDGEWLERAMTDQELGVLKAKARPWYESHLFLQSMLSGKMGVSSLNMERRGRIVRRYRIQALRQTLRGFRIQVEFDIVGYLLPSDTLPQGYSKHYYRFPVSERVVYDFVKKGHEFILKPLPHSFFLIHDEFF